VSNGELNHISPSSLGIWVQCPFKFKKLYLDKINIPPTEIERMELGNVLHSTLEKFYNRHTYGSELKSINDFLQVFEDVWVTAKIRTLALYKEAKDMAIAYYKAKLQGKKSYAIETEKKFKIPFSGFNVTGKIDKICKNGAKVIVTDYKTGGWFLSTKDLQDDLQLGIYALAIAKVIYPGIDLANLELELDYLKGPSITITKTKEELADLEQYLINTFKQMVNTRVYEPTPNTFCPSCQIKKMCPSYKQALEGDEVLQSYEAKEYAKVYGFKKLYEAKIKILNGELEKIKTLFMNALRNGEKILVEDKELYLDGYKRNWFPTIEAKKILEQYGLWSDNLIHLQNEELYLLEEKDPELKKALEAIKKVSIGDPQVQERKHVG
jgi:hypothetical protein